MLSKGTYKAVKTSIGLYYRSLTVADCASTALLTQNAKLAKKGKLLFGLSLLSATLDPDGCACLIFSGVNDCLFAKKLARGGLSTALQAAARRTWLYRREPAIFAALLNAEIAKLQAIHGDALRLRLNMASDHDWRDWYKMHPEVKGYDYTRVWSRVAECPDTYRLILSAKPDTTAAEIRNVIRYGHSVAVIFSGKVPKMYAGIKVVDGDADDDRWSTPRGVIVGLTLKQTAGGKAAARGVAR